MKNPYLLANCTSSQKDLENLGIILKQRNTSSFDERNQILARRCEKATVAVFPHNWNVEEEVYSVATAYTFFDAKGRPRIHSVFVNPLRCHVLNSFTEIYTRYYVKCINIGKAFKRSLFHIVLVDRANNTVVYSAGVTEYEPSYNIKKRCLNTDSTLVQMCEEYANERFPNWKNCLAYWD